MEDFRYLTRIHYKSENVPHDGRWGEHEIDYILFIQRDVTVNANNNEVKCHRYVNKQQMQEVMGEDILKKKTFPQNKFPKSNFSKNSPQPKQLGNFPPNKFLLISPNSFLKFPPKKFGVFTQNKSPRTIFPNPLQRKFLNFFQDFCNFLKLISLIAKKQFS